MAVFSPKIRDTARNLFFFFLNHKNTRGLILKHKLNDCVQISESDKTTWTIKRDIFLKKSN